MVDIVVYLVNSSPYYAEGVTDIHFKGDIVIISMRDKDFVSYLDDIEGLVLCYGY